MGFLRSLATDGLFIGQSQKFFEVLQGFAEDADAAERER